MQQKWFGSITSSPPPHPRGGYRKVGMLQGFVKRLFVIWISRRGSKFLNKIFRIVKILSQVWHFMIWEIFFFQCYICKQGFLLKVALSVFFLYSWMKWGHSFLLSFLPFLFAMNPLNQLLYQWQLSLSLLMQEGKQNDNCGNQCNQFFLFIKNFQLFC